MNNNIIIVVKFSMDRRSVVQFLSRSQIMREKAFDIVRKKYDVVCRPM